MVEQLAFEFTAPSSNLRELWTPDDIFRHADQATISFLQEDRRIERKSAKVSPKDLGDYLSMYANTQPYGGVLVIGIDKEGPISGCLAVGVEHINKLEQVRRFCSDARHEFKRIEVEDKRGDPDYVLLVRVYYREDRLVETAAGEAFIREGDEKRRLTETEKREIRISRGEIDYELEDINLKFPSDFEIPLIKIFCDAYKAKRNLKQDYLFEDVLVLAKMGRRTGGKFVPNLACGAIFARDPRSIVPGARIRFIRYEGNEEAFGSKLNSTSDAFVEGPLPYQLTELTRLIEAQMRNFTRLGRDGRFYTRAEYPKGVWLEAVVNACVHRSYNLRQMNIFVKMFDNKFVVESPGGFLPPTKPNNIYDAHNPRNPYLMEALFYLDFVKCAYEGTRRMREEMVQAELPEPEFAQKQISSHSVHVTLRNDVEHRKSFIDADVLHLVDEKTYRRLTTEEKLIINCIAERAYLNVTDASRLIKRDWRTAKSALDNLVELKVLDIFSRSGKAKDSSKRYVLRERYVKKTKQ